MERGQEDGALECGSGRSTRARDAHLGAADRLPSAPSGARDAHLGAAPDPAFGAFGAFGRARSVAGLEGAAGPGRGGVGAKTVRESRAAQRDLSAHTEAPYASAYTEAAPYDHGPTHARLRGNVGMGVWAPHGPHQPGLPGAARIPQAAHPPHAHGEWPCAPDSFERGSSMLSTVEMDALAMESVGSKRKTGDHQSWLDATIPSAGAAGPDTYKRFAWLSAERAVGPRDAQRHAPGVDRGTPSACSDPVSGRTRSAVASPKQAPPQAVACMPPPPHKLTLPPAVRGANDGAAKAAHTGAPCIDEDDDSEYTLGPGTPFT